MSSPTTPRRANWTWLPIAAALLVLSLGAYWRTRTYDFVWDDHLANLVGNPELLQGHYRYFWSHPYEDMYVPVTYSAWIWLSHLAGAPGVALTPEPFHTANVLVHAANTLLVFFLLCLVTRTRWPAALGAAVFGIHPLQVGSVVWITEFRSLLSTFFSLLAIVLYLRRGPGTRSSLAAGATATLCFVAAMLSKPTAVVVPGIVAALDFWVAGARRPRAYALCALWLVLAVPVMWITKSVQPDAQVLSPAPWLARPLIAAGALAFYLGKLIVPLHMSISYGRTPSWVSAHPSSYLLGIVPIALLALVWRQHLKHPLLVAGTIVVLMGIAPVSGIVPFKGEYYSTVADRYFYLPMIGIAIVLTWAASLLKNRPAVRIGRALAALGLAGLLWLNLGEQPAWASEIALWQHADENYPGQWQVDINYGVALAAANRHRDAVAAFDRAVAANPGFASAYSNRASSRSSLGDFEGALADRTRAVELDPGDAHLWYRRAGEYYRLGKLTEARADLDRARRLGLAIPRELSEGLDSEIQAAESTGR